MRQDLACDLRPDGKQSCAESANHNDVFVTSSDGSWHIFVMSYGEWIKSVLIKKRRHGLNQRRLAEHLGVHESVMSRIISGERELTVSELEEIARFLGETPPRLSTTALPKEPTVNLSAPIATRTIPVEVVVASGVWREKGSSVQDRTQVPASPDPRLAHVRQYACRIDGPEYGPLAGQYAVCVPYDSMRSVPTEPDTVHVVRTRGDIEEHSIRAVSVRNETTLLEPVAENMTPIRFESATVEIRGLVVGFFSPTKY